MDRTQRSEWLTRLADADISILLAHVPEPVRHRVRIVSGPTIGMVMARAIEGAHGEVFNVGEVLVTECHVMLDGVEGWAMTMGSRPTATRGIATIDVAITAGAVDTATIDGDLARMIAVQDAEAAASRAELAATRVQFETQ